MKVLHYVFFKDFGDYSESFYSVQTTEGEAISQLIAMYIDIIMQKKKPLHPDMPEDEDEPVIVESDVDPKKFVPLHFLNFYYRFLEQP